MKNFLLISSLIMISCSVGNDEPPLTFFEANHGIYAQAKGVIEYKHDPVTGLLTEGEKIGEIYYRIHPFQFADIYRWTKSSCYTHGTTKFSNWKEIQNNSRTVEWADDCDLKHQCAREGITRIAGYPSCPDCSLRYYYVPEDDPLAFSTLKGWKTNFKPSQVDVDTLRLCLE